MPAELQMSKFMTNKLGTTGFACSRLRAATDGPYRRDRAQAYAVLVGPGVPTVRGDSDSAAQRANPKGAPRGQGEAAG